MKNDYRFAGSDVVIDLKSSKYGNQETIISAKDFDLVNSMPNTWFVHWSPHGRRFYVVANLDASDGKRTTVKLHRWISKPSDDEVVDHINHNTLDNREENLRNLISRHNAQNREKYNKNSTTKVRGVSYRSDINKFRARIYSNRKLVYSENFNTLEEAGTAVKEVRERMFGFLKEDNE